MHQTGYYYFIILDSRLSYVFLLFATLKISYFLYLKKYYQSQEKYYYEYILHINCIICIVLRVLQNNSKIQFKGP